MKYILSEEEYHKMKDESDQYEYLVHSMSKLEEEVRAAERIIFNSLFYKRGSDGEFIKVDCISKHGGRCSDCFLFGKGLAYCKDEEDD
jgi:hypothetical protein